MRADEQVSFATRLSASLPATDHSFKYYHISSPPNLCPALYTSPPGCKPERTYCESHFLLVSSPAAQDSSDQDVAVFAFEALIYTTATLTTLFVSKADSTGLSSSADRPSPGASPSRIFTSTLVAHLVANRHRPDRKLVVSLFARAQGQYLFPGSVEHGKKHVLDDRQLVKWWCKTLDPVLQEYAGENETFQDSQRVDIRSRAYLIIPGHDRHETTGFYPPSVRKDSGYSKRWVNGHPLQQLATYPTAAPRCLVPRFPDDPKSRFLDDLDEELPDVPSSQTSELESPSKRGTGHWKSVKTLDQFWDAMAFRQECSSGRLVGFLWVVFRPVMVPFCQLDLEAPELPSLKSKSNSSKPPSSSKLSSHELSPLDRRKHKHKHRRSCPINPRLPRVKSDAGSSLSVNSQSEKTRDYYWPERTRGSIVLSQKEYARASELLLRLDFSNTELARASTSKWAREVSVMGTGEVKDWGVIVKGLKHHHLQPNAENEAPNEVRHPLSIKRKQEDGLGLNEKEDNNVTQKSTNISGINTLDVGSVRKKLKTTETNQQIPFPFIEPSVNNLNASLLRKKSKT